MERFSRPPNDPLFLSRSAADWMQFFYEEKCRERTQIESRWEALNAQITGSKEDHEARGAERKSLIRRYNDLARMLDLPVQPEDT